MMLVDAIAKYFIKYKAFFGLIEELISLDQMLRVNKDYLRFLTALIVRK